MITFSQVSATNASSSPCRILKYEPTNNKNLCQLMVHANCSTPSIVVTRRASPDHRRPLFDPRTAILHRRMASEGVGPTEQQKQFSDDDDPSLSEKEQDKLLTRLGNFRSSRYSEAGPSGAGSTGIQDTNRDGSSCSSSLLNKDGSHRGSKDMPSKKNEEGSPQANCKKKALKIVVTVLLIIIVVGIIVIWIMHEGRSKKHLGNKFFDFIAKKKMLHVYDDDDDIVLAGYLKTSETETGKLKKCMPSGGMDFCFVFEDDTQFQFHTYELENDTSVHCVNIVWDHVLRKEDIPVDCFDVEYGLWFGLPNYQGQFWPMNLDDLNIELKHYRPFQDKVFGNVLENYWLSTEGIAVIAHQKLPVRVSYNSGNDRKLCLSLDTTQLNEAKLPVFNYSICQGPDIKKSFIATRNAFLPKAPYTDYKQHDFANVVWNFENKQTNQDNFGDFLHKLTAAELPIHMIQYEAEWQKSPGDFRFEPMIKNDFLRYLNGKYSKSKLMLPITLACSYTSINFMTGVSQRFFVKDPQTQAFQTIRFLNETCGLWDATNPGTMSFIKLQLNLLQDTNTSDAVAFPQAFEIKTNVGNAPMSLLLYGNQTDINKMNEAFLNVLLDAQKMVIIDTAFRLQDKPAFVELPTVVGEKNGIKCLDNIIASALTAGIHGYSLFITTPPQDDSQDTEMFVRWLQIAFFFPALKVDNYVMNLGDDVVAMTKNLTSYREEVMIPLYSSLFTEVQQGYPVLRPLWWIDPTDYKTLKISDQFLVGSGMMVAPVLCQGVRSRDIYLPWGDWQHVQTGHVYTGHQWLINFEVPLMDIAVFILSNTTNTLT